MRDEAAYVRVYYSIIDDPRFVGIYDDDHHLATWLRLLLVADAMWPAPAPVPAGTRRPSLAALTAAGLIELQGSGRYRIHGLDAERERRAAAGRAGGLASGASRRRSTTDEQPPNDRSTTFPHRVEPDETRRDETRHDAQTRARPREAGPNGHDQGPEETAYAWLVAHGAGFPEGSGTYVHLVDLARRHGAEAVIEVFESFAATATRLMTGRQYVLGAENRLDRIPVAGPPPEPTEEERKRAAIMAFRGAGA